MKRKKNTSKHDEHKTPSAILLSAKQQTGGGKHVDSREQRNDRTGRLSGKAKRDLRGGNYD
jgi:hypothetical protein